MKLADVWVSKRYKDGLAVKDGQRILTEQEAYEYRAKLEEIQHCAIPQMIWVEQETSHG